MSFSVQKLGSFYSLGWQPWLDDGFRHGFIGVSGHFRAERLTVDADRLARELNVTDLQFLKQVHGSDVVPAENGLGVRGVWPEGDAWLRKLVRLEDCDARTHLPLCLQTADCLPIILRSEQAFSLVHAGWRGLAAGIVQKVLQLLCADSLRIEVVIGPAAAGECYEVGEEVVKEFGNTAVVTAGRELGKQHLYLAETAEKLLLESASVLGCEVEFFNCNCCTICSLDYHSHRRQGLDRGSNVTWAI